MKDCPDRYGCLLQALRLMKNQTGARHALILIARKGFQLNLKEMQEIFRWDYSTLSRNVHAAERKLKQGVKINE
jgi:hypothetical protein